MSPFGSGADWAAERATAGVAGRGQRADVIGGGVVGCSIAYRLAPAGRPVLPAELGVDVQLRLPGKLDVATTEEQYAQLAQGVRLQRAARLDVRLLDRTENRRGPETGHGRGDRGARRRAGRVPDRDAGLPGAWS